MKAFSVAMAAVTVCGLAAFGQQKPDPIEAAKANQRIADQKAEIEVRKALDDAERLAKSYPEKAIQYIKAAQLTLDTSGGLSGETRKNLTASLQGKLKQLQGKPDPAPGVKLDPAGPAIKAKQEAAWEQYLAEEKAVRDSISKIKQYQDANQPEAAKRLIADLSAKYPNHAAVVTLNRKENLGQAIDDAKALSEMAQKRVTLALNGPAKSAIPLGDRDVEFPKNWSEIKKRTSLNEIKLTEKEKKIIEALEKPVTISGKDKPLDYLLQEISTAMDQPLLIDERSLRELELDLKKNATLDARGISARTALRQVLAAQGLTYVIKNETIQVMTVEKARETLVTKAYYLGDVVQGVGPFGGGALWGPFLDYQQTMANVTLLTDAIQDSIDPLAWKKRGGPATLTFHFPTMSIIVRAPAEVHAALGSKISK
jgi:hypothetical protein